MIRTTSYAIVLALLISLLAAASAPAASIWNEGINGDISNNRLVPSSAVLALGSNTLTATSVGTTDREYITLQVPLGLKLAALVLDSYVGNDPTAFIGMQAGTQLTEPAVGTNVANILGYTHFGPGPGNVGADILPEMSTGAGAIGFVPPLLSASYTFWIQQTSTGNPATYTFDFQVTPEPTSLTLLALSAAGLVMRRRKLA